MISDDITLCWELLRLNPEENNKCHLTHQGNSSLINYVPFVSISIPYMFYSEDTAKPFFYFCKTVIKNISDFFLRNT